MSDNTSFVLRGNIADCAPDHTLRLWPDHFLVCEEGRVSGVFARLPQRWAGLPVYDYRDQLILPGLCDLHLHAPQYAFCGTGMDRELLDWLENEAFPEELRYAQTEYAQKAYALFVDELKRSATTRAVVFATLHRPATLLLMQLLEDSGLDTLVGKVSMDRNCPADYCEPSAAEGLAETRRWLEGCTGAVHCRPILTPRFTPAVSDEYMRGLGALQREWGLPVQSHLSENPSEIEWVQQLCPGTGSYAQSYQRFGLFGGAGCPTIMAHCVWCSEAEQVLMQQNGVYVAHCPASNINLRSGIAPVRRYLSAGLNMGLGSDVAAGDTLDLFDAIKAAVQVSKLRWRLVDERETALTLPEAFYLATRGGGSFFGQVGAFEPGFDMDAIVMAPAPSARPMGLAQQLERVCYRGGAPLAKFCQGRRVV